MTLVGRNTAYIFSNNFSKILCTVFDHLKRESGF
jgi:hypothetical protein